MAGRLSAQLVILVLVVASCNVFGKSSVLVHYNFDDQLLQPGPDTYRVFKKGGSKVAISYDIAQSGAAALHFSERAFDDDFVEFQGVFPPQTSGRLSVEFGFLITDQEGVFNFALVGANKYRLGPNGINFWLLYDGEWLRSYSNSIPIKVFQPQTFQWYTVRADLDLDRQSYSLRLIDERGAVVFSQLDLILAPGRHPMHGVLEYSFVGDIYDRQPTDLLIDNFSVTTSNNVVPEPLIAPGRKQLFVDRWKTYQEGALSKLQCLPAKDLNDFSIGIEDLVEILHTSQMEVLLGLTGDAPPIFASDSKKLHPALRALQYWRKSCALLSADNPAAAETQIDRALAIAPNAFIFQLTRIIIRASDLSVADVFVDISNLDQEDMRKDIALAMVMFHQRAAGKEGQLEFPLLSDDLTDGLQALTVEHRREIAKPETALVVERLKPFMPDEWEAYLSWYLALEQQYFQLLGAGDYQQAGQFADEVAERFTALALPAGLWRERAGDAALLQNLPELALQHYQVVNQEELRYGIELKLSDVYFLLGDFDKERHFRESVYTNFDQQ